MCTFLVQSKFFWDVYDKISGDNEPSTALGFGLRANFREGSSNFPLRMSSDLAFRAATLPPFTPPVD